jgi:hypothetical protein
VRRRVEAGFLWETTPRTECSEERLYESACASFAFGSSNMNNVELINVGSLREVSFALDMVKEVTATYRMANLVQPLPHPENAGCTF